MGWVLEVAFDLFYRTTKTFFHDFYGEILFPPTMMKKLDELNGFVSNSMSKSMT